VFSFLDRADGTPFVDADVPPTDLREYVTDYDAGEEPLPTLLEYADYSNSKLEHYVDDPGALRTAVAVHRTYVERLDAEPLTLDWPPAGGDELAYEIDELIPSSRGSPTTRRWRRSGQSATSRATRSTTGSAGRPWCATRSTSPSEAF